MDTRSSSGSGSFSINPNSGGLNPSQQATYTTAGTVYNPQTAPPLQPPARRGRATRWPPTAVADLSAFNGSVTGGFPRSRFRSPPTTASTLQHYTPLQQNHDRAIDPTQSTPTSLSNPRRAASGDSSTMSFTHALPRQLLSDEPLVSLICDVCGEQFEALENANHHVRVSGHENISKRDSFTAPNEENNRPGDDTLRQIIDDREEEQELAHFNEHSVRTLTSLASYPNPSQKIAQNRLDRARETYKPALGTSRPASRSSFRPGFDGAGPASSSYLAAGGREQQPMHYSHVPRNMYMTSSTRSSVLSNGPGAPQPLTAGPPGQRQFKASTFEGPLRALQESAQHTCSPDMPESLPATNPPSRLPPTSFGRQPSIQAPEPLRVGLVAPQSGEQDELWTPISRQHSVKKAVWTCKIRETRTLEQMRRFYGSSPPRDYNPLILDSAPNHNEDLKPVPFCRSLRHPVRDHAQRAELGCHRAMFYANADAVFMSFDVRFAEIRKEAQDRELGRIDSTEKGALTVAQMDAAVDSSQLGKARPIRMDLINRMEHSEAANILLAMTCSSFSDVKKRINSNPQPRGSNTSEAWPGHAPGYVGKGREARIAAKQVAYSTLFQNHSGART